jgi:CheY-like chemotaxis protein
MRALLVDDTIDLLELYKIVLQRQGYSVEIAHDGVEGTQAVQQLPQFDVIFLDIEMPRMNGWQALKAMRDLPKGQNAVIFLFTAYGPTVTSEDARHAGADELLRKPLMPQELTDAISKAMAARH